MNSLSRYDNVNTMDTIQNISEYSQHGTFYPKICDITNERAIQEVFEWADTLGGIGVLVNNAGIIMRTSLLGESF